MCFRGKMNSFFGLLGGGLLSLFARAPAKPGLDDLKRADITTSTQRLGVSFGEKIRDVFRFKWLKVSRRTSPGRRTDKESDRTKYTEDAE